MKLENQVTSLELSKRLKELGFKQESLFYWHKDCSRDNGEFLGWIMLNNNDCNKGISAYTVAELGEMLPVDVEKNNELYSLELIGGLRKGKAISYSRWDGDSFTQEAETEADARAKMLIYLKENNLI